MTVAFLWDKENNWLEPNLQHVGQGVFLLGCLSHSHCVLLFKGDGAGLKLLLFSCSKTLLPRLQEGCFTVDLMTGLTTWWTLLGVY